MEATNKDIIVYQPNHQAQAQQFSKRLPVEQFKKVDQKRIKEEFNVIRSAYTPNEQDVFHYEEKGKDRYSDIHTYKHNRIQIESMPGFYINASLMRSVIDNEPYAVFAQAPVKKVIEHFWYACYHYNIKKIVMLCSLQDPVRGVQAERYWPELNEEVKFTTVGLTLKCTSQNVIEQGNIRSKILMVGAQGEKELQHIHWSGWGDMKKPIGEKAEQLFRGIVQDCLELINRKELMMIHCSAGIGRTGTLGTTIEAMRCALKYKELSVFEIVDNMRRNRMGCVQTYDQYAFVYGQLQKML